MKEFREVKHNCVRAEGTMCKGQSKYIRAAMAAAWKWGLLRHSC